MIKIKRRNRLQRFWLRFTVSMSMLFLKRHYVVIYVTIDQLKDIITDGELKDNAVIDLSYVELSLPYAQQLIQCAGRNIDETEVICNKAEWEASAMELLKKNK